MTTTSNEDERHYSEQDEDICARFLRCMKTGERGKEFETVLAELLPILQRTVYRVAGRFAKSSTSLSVDDICQEVQIRLLINPPISENRHSNAYPILVCWIKTTTYNYCIDLYRKWMRDTELADISRSHKLSEPDPIKRIDDKLNASQQLKSALNYLKTRYPKGYEVQNYWQENPDATTEKVCEALSLTRDNYYQIQKRTKKYLSDWDSDERYLKVIR